MQNTCLSSLANSLETNLLLEVFVPLSLFKEKNGRFLLQMECPTLDAWLKMSLRSRKTSASDVKYSILEEKDLSQSTKVEFVKQCFKNQLATFASGEYPRLVILLSITDLMQIVAMGFPLPFEYRAIFKS